MYAPQPPEGSNITMVIPDNADKKQSSPQKKQIPDEIIHQHTYPFGTTITYECMEKTRFSHDYNQLNVSATCLKENHWTIPDYWGKCTIVLACVERQRVVGRIP